MPLFMSQWRYTPEALQDIAKGAVEDSDRVARMVKELGGELLCYYNCYGEYDAMAIARMPDGVTNLAAVFAAISAGTTQSSATTQLFDAEDMKKAASLAAGYVGK